MSILATTNVYRLGDFQVAWNHGNITIYDANDMSQPIWYTVSKQPFIEVSWNHVHGDPIQQGHLLQFQNPPFLIAAVS